MNIEAFKKEFNTQEKCIKYLEKIRWGNRPVCVHCGRGNRITTRKGTHIHHCNECNKDTTVLMNSPMQHSRLPLMKWFHIIYLMLHTNKTARQISRETKVAYQNIWHANMRIRCFMVTPETGQEIIITLRDDLRKFIKERGLSEKEELKVGGFDKTIQQLLSSYEGEKGNYQSLLGSGFTH